jgi:phospholipase D1/2
MTAMVFPGQDYNNSRVADFENVQAWTGNEQARTELGRMPWHDVHTMLTGPSVMDIAQFFVERWNFVRDLKYKHNDRFPLLDWPHDDPLNDQMLRHPHTGGAAFIILK